MILIQISKLNFYLNLMQKICEKHFFRKIFSCIQYFLANPQPYAIPLPLLPCNRIALLTQRLYENLHSHLLMLDGERYTILGIFWES